MIAFVQLGVSESPKTQESPRAAVRGLFRCRRLNRPARLVVSISPAGTFECSSFLRPFRVRPPFARWRAKSCDTCNSPKGLRKIVLGCREAQRSGYPGLRPRPTPSTLKGLRSVAPPLRNPFGVNVLRWLETQGSRCATTLGYLTQSLRDNRCPASSQKADGL